MGISCVCVEINVSYAYAYEKCSCLFKLKPELKAWMLTWRYWSSLWFFQFKGTGMEILNPARQG